MRTYILRGCLITICCTFFIGWLGCGSETQTLDPEIQPYTLEEENHHVDPFWPIDLDSDGYDERVQITDPPPSHKKTALALHEFDGQIIDQVNYAHPINNPHFLELDDGDIDILVPFVRNDSLFASIVAVEGNEVEKKQPIFLTSGKPRRENDGLIDWDPMIRGAFLEDVNADGHDELITVIATGYARRPRGVWVHSLQNGELLGHAEIAGMPSRDMSFIGDFDDDGRQDIILSTGASNNGAVLGDMDDEHSYLVAFDIGIPPHVKPSVAWREEKGGLGTAMELLTGDLDGDGKDEFLAFKQTLMGQGLLAELQVIDPKKGESLRAQTLSEPITGIAMVDLDRDTKAEILALGLSGELKVLSSTLSI